jgi:lambda repressor-like predicted transcriptional regulator
MADADAKRALRAKGYSLQEIADKLGVSRQAVQQTLRGEPRPCPRCGDVMTNASGGTAGKTRCWRCLGSAAESG